MKSFLLVFLFSFITYSYSHAHSGDPALGDSILCIHHTQGEPSENYGMVIAPRTCSAYVGTVAPDPAEGEISCQEFHPKGAAPYIVCTLTDGSTRTKTHSSSSQHCWVEERNMGG